MNICMVCPEIGNTEVKAFIGGHVNCVISLSKLLAHRGHNITIVTTPHRFGKGKNIIDWAEIHTLNIKAPYLSLQYGAQFAILAAMKVLELAKYKNIDLIHGHSGYISPVLVSVLSGIISKLPVIHSIYCPVGDNGYNNIATSSFFNWVGIMGLNRTKKIIAVTNNIFKSLMKIGINKSKIELIPLFINTDKFNANACGEGIKRENNINKEHVLVYVGNLSEKKGLHVLLDSFRRVLNKYPSKLIMVLNVPLDVYNKPQKLQKDMDLLNSVKIKIKELNLENNIIPMGLTDQLENILAAGDIFIAPFLSITGIADYPMSLLEAMAIGKPVIATTVGGIPEIIEDNINGILVEPGNHIALEEAILRLIENIHLAKALGKNASDCVLRQFGYEKNVAMLEQIYSEVHK